MAAAFVPLRLPKRLAVAAGLALLFCDRAAPLLLSPQSGWHFGAAARWVWLTFAAAGTVCTQPCTWLLPATLPSTTPFEPLRAAAQSKCKSTPVSGQTAQYCIADVAAASGQSARCF